MPSGSMRFPVVFGGGGKIPQAAALPPAVGFNFLRVVLTPSQYMTLNQLTQIIPAPGVGRAAIPVHILGQRAFNGVAYSNLNTLRVRHSLTGTTLTNALGGAIASGASDIYSRFGIDWNNTVPTFQMDNQPVYAIPDTTVTGGSANDRIRLDIVYQIIQLS